MQADDNYYIFNLILFLGPVHQLNENYNDVPLSRYVGYINTSKNYIDAKNVKAKRIATETDAEL